MSGNRTRVRGGMSVGTIVTDDYYGPLEGGGLYSHTVHAEHPEVSGETALISDFTEKNYARRKKSGAVLMNALVIDRTRKRVTDSDWTFGPAPYWGTRHIYGPCAAKASKPPTIPAWYAQRQADAKLSTLVKAHSKVADSDFMGMVSVAEASKTAKTIAGPLSGAQGLLQKMISSRISHLKRGLTFGAATAAAWNEYRFGWKPLLYDIEGQFKAYCDRTDQNDKPVRLVARGGDKVEWKDVEIYNPSFGGLTGLTMKGSYSLASRINSGVIYELHDENLGAATRRRMGVRLSDVPAALWELVPWSFVVDRFLSVGQWLQAITPKPGVSVLAAWTTVVEEIKYDYDVVLAWVDPTDSLGSYHFVSSGGSFGIDRFRMNRERNPSLPSTPTVNYRDLSLVQQIDHAALLYQQLFNFGAKHLK